METGGSLQPSQQPAICSCPEPDKSSPRTPILFLQHLLEYCPSTYWYLRETVSKQHTKLQFCLCSSVHWVGFVVLSYSQHLSVTLLQYLQRHLHKRQQSPVPLAQRATSVIITRSVPVQSQTAALSLIALPHRSVTNCIPCLSFFLSS